MIQVSSRSTKGSIKTFRVHDLIHDLAMHEAAKENFMTVLPKQLGCNDYPDIGIRGIGTRRVSVQSNYCNEITKQIGPHTRSLLWFLNVSGSTETESINMEKLFDKCRLLRIVQVVDGEKIELWGVDRLIHLKYLRLSPGWCTIPDGCSLGRLKNLETLDACITADISNMGLWTIGTLRHVSFAWLVADGPPSLGDLKNLQSVYWVSVKELDQLAPNRHHSYLNNLRRLGLFVKDDQKYCWDRVRHLLGTLPSLLSLKIGVHNGQNLPAEIVYPRMLPNYENLQSLYLCGKWPNEVPALKAALLPPRLLTLTLIDSELANDPMPELGLIESLRTLRLINNVYSGRKELICPSGFPLLQTLHLGIPYTMVESVTIVEGAMPNLKRLNYHASIHLQLPPALQHLSSF